MQKKRTAAADPKSEGEGSGCIFQSDLFLYEGSVPGGNLDLDE